MSDTRFIGEYACSLDSKGRMMMPMGLRKQIPPEAKDRFVVNRGFEKHLVLWPMNEWEQTTEQINKLNTYVKDNLTFVRYFYRGASELELDGTGRILLPKTLLEYAGIGKDAIMFAFINRIEIWSEEMYNKQLAEEPKDFVQLAEQVMGKSGDGPMWMRN